MRWACTVWRCTEAGGRCAARPPRQPHAPALSRRRVRCGWGWSLYPCIGCHGRCLRIVSVCMFKAGGTEGSGGQGGGAALVSRRTCPLHGSSTGTIALRGASWPLTRLPLLFRLDAWSTQGSRGTHNSTGGRGRLWSVACHCVCNPERGHRRHSRVHPLCNEPALLHSATLSPPPPPHHVGAGHRLPRQQAPPCAKGSTCLSPTMELNSLSRMNHRALGVRARPRSCGQGQEGGQVPTGGAGAVVAHTQQEACKRACLAPAPPHTHPHPPVPFGSRWRRPGPPPPAWQPAGAPG